MPRIDLTVSFAEKDDAKRLGARWDGERKVWYVPDGVDVSAFERWLPSEPDIGVRSSSYFIAQSAKPCWKCNELTSVYGFILLAGHETLDPDEEDDDRDAWYRYTSRQDRPGEKEWLDALRSEKARLSEEADFSVVPSFKVEMRSWCRFVEIVAPIEVRNSDELRMLANLVRRILKGETTLEREFPGYVYGKAEWVDEGLAMQSPSVVSHRVAGT